MRTVTDFPRAVRQIRHTWIPLADSTRLAARVWLPEDAEADPVPAILEYIPYRKNDGTAVRDQPMHHYFAGHGYASVRVDMRGSGDSDGILEDEYLPLEQEDALEVLRWLAAQPWCTGKVGIIGKSWGGFNGLQIAAHAPPELGAVISVASTDDRYSDDVHYMGGCLLAYEMLLWASTMLAYNARPPDPQVVGERWREMWLDRLERTPPFVEAWVAHQRRDAFWKQGSVCEDYAAIRCPVYMVGGWVDAYRNAILRFLDHYPGPCKGLIGPWGHLYPQDGVPAPAIGFLQESVRWWDAWLKDVDNGIKDEPRLRVWMQDAVRPAPGYVERPGRWISNPERESRSLVLDTDLRAGDAAQAPRTIRGREALAGDAGDWCGWGSPTDCPADQRADDGQSLCWDSPPLGEELEIFGSPKLRADIAADRRAALVAVRLCDVWPDGDSTLITRGLLNLTHRAGHEEPEPLEPGRRYDVEVKLNAIAYSLPPGHRLRVAISPTYWPWAWPSPEPVILSAYGGALDLPVLAGGGEGDVPAHFAHPEQAPPLATEAAGVPLDPRRTITRDVASGMVEVVDHHGHSGLRLLDSDLVYSEAGTDTWRICEGNPLSAYTRCEREIELQRDGWCIRIETESTLTATHDEFYVTNSVDAYEGGSRVRAKTWHARIPRDHT